MSMAGLKVTILGCGSSAGVPRIGGADGRGDWGACDPANPRNRRRRCAILVESKGTRILVDTPPELREQLIDAGCGTLDAVLITHEHADQLHGLDDLRAVAQNMRARVPVYGAPETLAGVVARFGYCFETPPGSDYPPVLTAHEIERPFRPFELKGQGAAIPVLAFDQDHGQVVSQGFRFGTVAYSSDVVGLPDISFDALDGVACWIVDCLRYRPHKTHAHLEKTLSWIERVRPRLAVLTNLHNDLDYETLAGQLPPGVVPAFDGMVLEI